MNDVLDKNALIALIQEKIKNNGKEEITGDVLQAVLIDMVDNNIFIPNDTDPQNKVLISDNNENIVLSDYTIEDLVDGVKGPAGPAGTPGFTIKGEITNTTELYDYLDDNPQINDAYILNPTDSYNDSNVEVQHKRGAVYVYNGSNFVYLTNICGPKGDRGLKGDQGERGETGAPGQGVIIVGTKNSTNELPVIGDPHELYLVNGDLYVWVENDYGNGWVNMGSLIGPTGPKGDKGDKGDIGPTGPAGAPGKPGIGVKGDKGDQGPKGEKGDTGPTGQGITITGTLGSTEELPIPGDPCESYLIGGELYVWNDKLNEWVNVGKLTGEQGPTGPTGDTGPQGERGPIGQTGDTGPQGPAGSYTAGTNISINNDIIGVTGLPETYPVLNPDNFIIDGVKMTMVAHPYRYENGNKIPNNNASADYSTAIGFDCETTQQAKNSFVGGDISFASHEDCFVYGKGLNTIDAYETVIGKYNNYNHFSGWGADKPLFEIGDGADENHRKTVMMVQKNYGKAFVYTSWNVQQMGDFAEYFEWADGNPDNEDRVGLMVQLNGEKIEPAQSFENVIGIVSGNPSFVADSAALDWYKRYQKDNFGRYIVNAIGDMVENPEYDNTKTYIPREQRPEWSTVSILGKVYVRHDGNVQTGGFATLGENGIATSGTSGYRVLKRVDNESALVLVK